jgi:hypothetical protein
LSGHDGIKPELNSKRNYRKIFKHMETEKHIVE